MITRPYTTCYSWLLSALFQFAIIEYLEYTRKLSVGQRNWSIDFHYSQQIKLTYFLRMPSSGMWHCVDHGLTDVSEESTASIFLRNVSLPRIYTAPHPRR
jgi:hypothetical protein